MYLCALYMFYVKEYDFYFLVLLLLLLLVCALGLHIHCSPCFIIELFYFLSLVCESVHKYLYTTIFFLLLLFVLQLLLLSLCIRFFLLNIYYPFRSAQLSVCYLLGSVCCANAVYSFVYQHYDALSFDKRKVYFFFHFFD